MIRARLAGSTHEGASRFTSRPTVVWPDDSTANQRPIVPRLVDPTRGVWRQQFWAPSRRRAEAAGSCTARPVRRHGPTCLRRPRARRARVRRHRCGPATDRHRQGAHRRRRADLLAHDLRHRRVSLWHRLGLSWAEIGGWSGSGRSRSPPTSTRTSPPPTAKWTGPPCSTRRTPAHHRARVASRRCGCLRSS